MHQQEKPRKQERPHRAEGRKEYYDASGKKPGVNRPRLCIDSWNKYGMYLLSPSPPQTHFCHYQTFCPFSSFWPKRTRLGLANRPRYRRHRHRPLMERRPRRWRQRRRRRSPRGLRRRSPPKGRPVSPPRGRRRPYQKLLLPLLLLLQGSWLLLRAAAAAARLTAAFILGSRRPAAAP